MDLRGHIWVWKKIAQIAFISMMVVSFFTFLSMTLPASITENFESISTFGATLVATLAAGFYIRSQIITVNPKHVSRIVIKVGGVITTKNSLAVEQQEREVIEYLKEKYTIEKLPELVKAGEEAFTLSSGNGYDFLFNFIEFFNPSGKKLQFLSINKSDRQVKLVQALPRGTQIDWSCSHINQSLLTKK
jgi:apolipoprotein N-acyltransferase